MSDASGVVKLAKWPFYLADVALSGVVFFVLWQLGAFEGTSDVIMVGICLVVAAVAAWISILPWLREHEASAQLTESTNLKSSVEQIKGVEKVAELIRQSNAQWQGIQDTSARTIASAQEITEKMKVEAEEFMRFMAQAHDQERAGLRLEVEKLRRMEGDWIKVTVGMLDHTYAIFRAAERSGQQGLINQLGQFQNACRDVARRMGLAPFLPAVGENFDARSHQAPDAKTVVEEGAKVREVLASGFTYQGQLLRRALVVVVVAEGEEDGDKPPLEEATEMAEGAVENPVSEEMAPEDSAGEEPLGEDAEIAAGVEVFEDVGEPERVVESGGLAPEEPGVLEPEGAEPAGPPREKKPSPQDELPF